LLSIGAIEVVHLGSARVASSDLAVH
jgi:hypothetical protein